MKNKQQEKMYTQNSDVFVTYLTIYLGEKLPPFYIGSTKLSTAESGKYFGSVSSLRFKQIFDLEKQENPSLFKLFILSYHFSRNEAFEAELKLQNAFDVVCSPLFVNQAKAQKNGCWGNTLPKTDSHKRKISENNASKRPEIREKLSNSAKLRKNVKVSSKTKAKLKESLKGFQHSKITKDRRAATLRENKRIKFLEKLARDNVDESLWENKLAEWERLANLRRDLMKQKRQKTN